MGETGHETKGLSSDEAVEKVESGRGLSLSSDRILGLGRGVVGGGVVGGGVVGVGVVGEDTGAGRVGLGRVRRENSYTVSSSSKLTPSSVSPLKQLA